MRLLIRNRETDRQVVYVCVWEREKESERKRAREREKKQLLDAQWALNVCYHTFILHSQWYSRAKIHHIFNITIVSDNDKCSFHYKNYLFSDIGKYYVMNNRICLPCAKIMARFVGTVMYKERDPVQNTASFLIS